MLAPGASAAARPTAAVAASRPQRHRGRLASARRLRRAAGLRRGVGGSRRTASTSPERAGRHLAAPTGKKQRNTCPSRPRRSAPALLAALSRAYRQRGANLHPGGGAVRSGGWPGMLYSLPAPSAATLGQRLEQRLGVRVARVGEQRVGASAVSTIRPAYMTATRSARPGDHAQVVGDQDDRHAEALRAGRRSAPGSASGWSRRARWSARRRSAASARRPAPSRSSRAGACRRTAGAGSSPTRSAGRGMPTRPSTSTARVERAALRRAPVQPHRLGDLVADRHRRVQRGHRVLEDHADRRCRAPAASAPRSAQRSRCRPARCGRR